MDQAGEYLAVLLWSCERPTPKPLQNKGRPQLSFADASSEHCQSKAALDSEGSKTVCLIGFLLKSLVPCNEGK